MPTLQRRRRNSFIGFAVAIPVVVSSIGLSAPAMADNTDISTQPSVDIAQQINPEEHDKAVSNHETGEASSIAALIDAVAPHDASGSELTIDYNPWAEFDLNESKGNAASGDAGIEFIGETEPVEIVDNLAISTNKSEDLDLVQRPTAQGEQFLTVLGSEKAPTQLSYELDLPKGSELKQLDDGSIEISAPTNVEVDLPGEDQRIEAAVAEVFGTKITSLDDLDNITDEQFDELASIPDVETKTITQMQPLATIEAPWAVDGAGNAVNTSYTLDGNTLTQTVEVGADTVFPVVADPSWTWWAEKGAKCVGSLVTLGAFGYAKISLGIAKLVTKMSKASKTSSLGKAYAAWNKLGTSNKAKFNELIARAKNFAQDVVKKGASSAFAKHRKQSTKSAAMLVLLREGGLVVASVFGVKSCFEVVREVWK